MNYFTLQEVVNRSGLSEHTLRYYEQIGLLDKVNRDRSSGLRRYTEEDLRIIEAMACLRATGFLGPILFQSAAQGALPTLFAATAPEAKGGGYYGPDGFNETRGFPTAAKIPPQAEDAGVATRLWMLAEGLTCVSFAQASARELATF